MNKIRFAKKLLSLNVLFWVVYNTALGWNQHPETLLEERLDWICESIFEIIALIYLLPLFRLYESAIKKTEEK